MRISKYFSATCLLTILLFCSTNSLAQYQGAVDVPESLKTGFDSITDEQSKAWLNILTGPHFAGRGTGQPGFTKAAHWVSGKVAEFGLEPMGNGGSYFQMLPMTRKIAVPSESSIEGPNGLMISGEEHIGFQRLSEQPLVSGSIVFVSAKGDDPKIEADILRDKIVILSTDSNSDFRAQIMVARQQPAGVIKIADGKPNNQSEVGSGGRRSSGTWCSISPQAAKSLVESTGANPDWLKAPENDGAQVNSVEGRLSISVRVREEKMVVPNVVAWLEGSDPNLKDEYIVLGAHLDHLGTRGGQTFPGADDNGSGSTAILSVAKAMAMNPVKPKRSIMFIWFAAEEIGLVGSRYYVDNPTQPLDKIVCMLNCDMVGRNEETANESASENENTIHLIGSKKGETKLHDIIMDANQYVNFEFEYDQESVFGRSDQANFWNKGIPVAFVFGGFHPDYHQTTDKHEKINFHKISSAAKLFYISMYNAAEYPRSEMRPKQTGN